MHLLLILCHSIALSEWCANTSVLIEQFSLSRLYHRLLKGIFQRRILSEEQLIGRQDLTCSKRSGDGAGVGIECSMYSEKMAATDSHTGR